MQNEFTAIVERDGKWFVAYCPEVPEANGQGKIKRECLKNLTEAVRLVLQDKRESALRGVPDSTIRETLLVQ